ncbi:DUF58 domain-containing protein [Evansella tamaricis]|uniref:DUF58 domain-containing protein n=1 Tax=Evansella tamaricis TaxID=2069301 RepID=A0ABS6JFA8_9BACI|nr:DUF58 domain-containing protein [Evansella tamaricis]MBU9712347.1 DUF58 domain-containing protein [Evansella tamaricis]
MLQQWKEYWMPKDQQTLFVGILLVWFCSTLFFLFAGGKLSFILFLIMSIITVYLMMLTRWSGIKEITGKRIITKPMGKQRIESDDTLTVSMTFKIPGFWPLPYVFIKDQVKHHHAGETLYESSFVPDYYRSGSIVYTIPSLRRGKYEFGETECSTVDLLNLFEHKSSLKLPVSLNVFPRTIPIRKWSSIARVKKSESYPLTTPIFQKETTEMDGVKEYIQGDRLSKIHWKASAKTGILKSKEFIKESKPRINLLLDQFPLVYQSDRQFELAVSVAASLIQYTEKNHLPTGLFSPGCNIRYFEPKGNTTFFHQLENHLLEVNKDGKFPIYEVMFDRRFRQMTDSTLVIISPDTSEDFYQRLKWLKRMNIHACHIWVSPEEDTEHSHWQKALFKHNILFYRVGELKELPAVLGGDYI